MPVSSSVFEVVVSRKRPVDVPGDGAVLRRLLTETHTEMLHEAAVFFFLVYFFVFKRNAIFFNPPNG